MTLICLIGSSYSGKSYFLEKLSKICDFTRISLGDIFRAKGEKGICVTPEALKIEVRKALAKASIEGKNNNIILDNAFKNVEQAKAVIPELKGFDIKIVYVENHRKNIDLTSRGREDDINVSLKIREWEKNWPALYDYLRERFVITTVLNNDYGFNII